ncbi:hypothetical protein NLJ89_g391 [Agrocybe chaxingu]|uniref:WW domain-containing protein n=1 Tax=Agrocybe chaxingu TaxID=84603 RepID=A0A9W8N231_9AGAR|nr:hypothetical protein NLJ89_g391 [Agrocybe chaxingu]
MPAAPRNPDTRPLPEGWAEHFDSQRELWYYIDLNASTPRVTFVHPCDGTHPASAPVKSPREHGAYGRLAIRPVGGRDNPMHAATAASRDPQRTRRATVAQQLYASSLTLESRNPPPPSLSVDSKSRSSSRRPSVSSTHSKSPSDETTASSSTSLAAVAATACSVGGTLPVGASYPPAHSTTSQTHLHQGLANVSSSTPSAASLTHLDSHDPRNYFDCTRLSRGTRRMTYAGPQPGPSSRSGAILGVKGESTKDGTSYTAQAFYHPSVVTSPLASPAPKVSSGSNYTQRRPSLFPPATSSVQQHSTSNSSTTLTWNPPRVEAPTPPIPPTPSHFPDENLYSAVTEDNLMVVHSHHSDTSPNHFSDAKSSYAAITEDNLLVMPSHLQNRTSTRSKRRSFAPIDVALLQNSEQSNTRPLKDISTMVERPILQPKPVKPINTVSLDFQVQVAENPAESDEPPETHSKAKRKSNVLKKGIGLGIGKNTGQKGTHLRVPRNRGSTDVSRELDGLASRMDSSFVILDGSDMRNGS